MQISPTAEEFQKFFIFEKDMTRKRRNAFLMFVGLALALFTSFWDSSFVCNAVTSDGDGLACICTATQEFDGASQGESITDPYSHSPAAILNTRRPQPQASFRPYRPGSIQGYHGRSGNITSDVGFRSSHKIAALAVGQSGFPQASRFSLSKDYYVYTLERMLC